MSRKTVHIHIRRRTKDAITEGPAEFIADAISEIKRTASSLPTVTTSADRGQLARIKASLMMLGDAVDDAVDAISQLRY